MTRFNPNGQSVNTLEEDLRALHLLPEAKEAHKDEDDAEEPEAADDDEEDQNEHHEAASRVLESFAELSEEEVEELDEAQIATVERAAELLGVDLTERYKKGNKRTKGKAQSARQYRKTRRANRNKRTCKKGYEKVGSTCAKVSKADKTAAQAAQKTFRQRHSDTDTIDNIIERLDLLTQPVTEDRDLDTKIVEGFTRVFETANNIADGIASELAESKFDEDDARFQIGNFFHGIAEDAENILKRIETGEVDVDDAVEDLQSISYDLQKGVEQMKTID